MAPTIAVGTTNPGKVAAVERALAFYPTFKQGGWVISPHKVDSNVSDQVRGNSPGHTRSSPPPQPPSLEAYRGRPARDAGGDNAGREKP